MKDKLEKFFCGVPNVRIVSRGKPKQYIVQLCLDDGSGFKDIGDIFYTLDEAIDQAPVLCEF